MAYAHFERWGPGAGETWRENSSQNIPESQSKPEFIFFGVHISLFKIVLRLAGVWFVGEQFKKRRERNVAALSAR